ncbi:MAG TPA: dTDP-4-dehydrorhamnose reductase [Gemmatimonadaceae bacterium]|nr:dTDP-4-dehydrorhamnose reductase [Gemmatimonadaceae bacterium]
MRVLVTGSRGQLGVELQCSVPDGVEVLALDLDTLDITDPAALDNVFREFLPTTVINAAAFTAVDRAEDVPEEAFAVNARGALNVAQAAVRAGARVIHVSTDFVFDGESPRPYEPTDEPAPVNAYGKSKLEGERAVLSHAGPAALVIRTAWLYAAHGSNFVTTMLRLIGERDVVRVVADQVGTPTSASGLARAIWSAAAKPHLHGVMHWTDAGVASWYDFAVAIREAGLAAGLLNRAAPVQPILTRDYPTKARRPRYSVLDKSLAWAALGIQPVHWNCALRAVLGEKQNLPLATRDSRPTTPRS